jgi:hypothetical protein
MRRNRMQLPLLTCLLVAGAIAGLACGNQNKRETNKAMFKSDEDFKRGRTDGKRDSKWSMTDASASWMWLWMANEQYGQGYHQGWTEGRAEVKFKQEEERARKDTKRDESDPNVRNSSEE